MDVFFIVYNMRDRVILIEITVYHAISTFSKNKGKL